MPKTPPEIWDMFAALEPDRALLERTLSLDIDASSGGKYLHWDKLRHYQPPEGLTHEQWWLAIKMKRLQGRKAVPLMDRAGKPFSYCLVDPIHKMLHGIDQGAAGQIRIPEQITNPETRDQYQVSSLIQEAITSSQIEGAATTREVAKEMIKTGRAPRDRSEQMILNNFITMQRISALKAEPLSRDLVFEIHRIITQDTLEDPSAAGRFRQSDQRIAVMDMYNQVFHTPPPAHQLDSRLQAMCDFANESDSEVFVHPVIRSIILHFWLAYDHPFVDGNGRAARALFYWSMLRHGYWLFEFISISGIIRRAPAIYGRAFLYTETDDNDLTYFIIYHLRVIERAVRQLHEYIAQRTRRLQEIDRRLRGFAELNHRQRELISHALRHPHHRYTIRSHQVSHSVVYQTSRMDLLDLVARGLLAKKKIRRTWYFTPAADLEERLAKM